MAQQAVELDQEQFNCPICLDLLKDPVTVPCGHNYCSRCIEQHWDHQAAERGRWSCPQCRHTFDCKPVLKKNHMLAEVVDKVKETALRELSHCYAGPGDVACDCCTTGREQKAVKTCLQCMVSYCDAHLQPHYQCPAFKKHELVKATSKLRENICSCHDEVKKVFCRTDRQCICFVCSMEEHRGHDTVTAAAERTERQKELDRSEEEIQQRLRERERDLALLRQEVKSICVSADGAVEESDTILTELISSVEKTRSEVRELIRDQQKREVTRVEDLRNVMEQEVAELRRQHAEVKRLSHTEDHVHFLHSYTSPPKISQGTGDVICRKAQSLSYFEDVAAVVATTRVKLEQILKEQGANISEAVCQVDVLLSKSPNPETRTEFLKYSRPITLDPNTAHQCLSLSKGDRKATRESEMQLHPHHPERFTDMYQVLSAEALTERCYWEVEWSENAHIAVAYKDIGRTGITNECAFGYNDKSWSLQCYCGLFAGYVYRHQNVNYDIGGRVTTRIGVYLDHGAGTLAFYSIEPSDTMTLLHRVQTTFTQPLYAGFWLPSFYGGEAEFCKLT